MKYSPENYSSDAAYSSYCPHSDAIARPAVGHSCAVAAYSMRNRAECEACRASVSSHCQSHYSPVAVAVVGRAAEILSFYSELNRAVVQCQAEMAIVAVQFVAGVVVEASLSAVSAAPTSEFVDF